MSTFLIENGIQTSIHYPIPPHKQKAYIEWKNTSYPISEKIHKEILSLPMGSFLKNNDINKIIETVNKYEQ